MRTRAGHLRLIPKPLAKCPPPRAYPPEWDTVEIRRDGRKWKLVHAERGRLVELSISTATLRDLVEQGSKLLAMDEEDV